MANTYKNIVITPNTSSTTGDPTIQFSGGNTASNSDVSLRVYSESNGVLSFEATAGQLLSITNDLTGTIFTVNDVSGMPLIEVNATSQQITFGQYYGNVGIGTVAANSSIYKLDVAGTVNAASIVVNGSSVIINNKTTLISTGYSVLTYNAGANVAAYGTWTPDPANGNYQFANSNGAFTIAAPASNCAIDVLFTNGLGGAGNNAGAITFSGYTAVSGGGGDTYATTANNKYILMIRRINSISTYAWKALQ